MNASRTLAFAAAIMLPQLTSLDAAPTARVPSAAPASLSSSNRLAWWREARFGMFIHWGPVSLKGTEISWSRANSNPLCPNKGPIPCEVYDNLYKEFNPTNFNATEWVNVAKAGGMKYVVLTAKHCDGFCLWPTRTIDHHIGNTPFRRDVCQELAKAVHDAGLRLGWYYSPMDWFDPDCRTGRNAAYVKRMQDQLQELLSGYGRLDLLWFDWDGGTIPWDQDNTYKLVRTSQPEMIVNNRLDCRFGEFSADRYIGPQADYYTPEQVVGAYDDKHPWETCMTLGTQWSWKPEDTIKPVSEALRILVKCVGGDGNLLLNVGPMPDGRIEPRQVAVLEGIGNWLSTHGESIYGTRGGPFKPGEYGASTRKENTVYVHGLNWTDDSITLPTLPARILRYRLLGGHGVVKAMLTPNSIKLTVNESDRDPLDTVIALDLDKPASQLVALEVPEPVSLALKARATASNVYQGSAEFGPQKAVDGNKETRWATDAGVLKAWLELDLGHSVAFNRARILEAFPNRVQKFELQTYDGSQWKTFYHGTLLGESWTGRFATVTAQRVRLNILEASDGPTLWEFQLFNSAK